MKVFAPERVIRIGSYADLHSGSTFYYGIPMSGAWIDADDYFRQVTSRGAINDVVHAKVVTSTGVPYTCGDLTTGTRFYPCSGRARGNVYFYDNVSVYLSHEVDELVYPDYKGKKPIQPRRRKYTVRSTKGACLRIALSTTNGAPTLDFYLWSRCPKRGDDEVRSRYSVARSEAHIRTYGSGNSKYWSGYASTHVVPLWNNLISLFSDTFGEHAERYVPSEWLVGREKMHTKVLQLILVDLYAICEYVEAHVTVGSYYTAEDVTGVTTDTYDVRSGFLLDEDLVIGDRLDPLVLGREGGAKSYWRTYLQQHALLAALETFPKLSDNSISNALEVLGFIKALVLDHRIEIPQSLSSAWLAYRYQFKTTEMDIKEAIKFVRRNSDLGGLDRGIKCYGTASHIFEDGTEVTCRCECLVVPQIVTTVVRLLRTLDTYGLTPDFYVIWDMIPFSFMVDWFVPIGEILGVEDTNAKFLSGEFYKIMWVCYSLSYTREFANARVSYYTRWRGSIPSRLDSMYWLEPPSAGSRVTTFRILDAASIFIGR